MGKIESWLERILASKRNKIMDFYWGEVVLYKQSLKYSRYRIIENNAIIDVHVAAHVRLVSHQFSLPPTFDILAAMKYIKVVSGTVPSHHIHQMKVKEYTAMRSMYNTK